MKLPFRYQFLLAPLSVVLALVLLVGYTLYELANINQENARARDWELVTDRVQAGIAAIRHLNRVIIELNSEYITLQDLEQDDHYFSYLEQSRLILDNLYDHSLLEKFGVDLKSQLNANRTMLLNPERTKPVILQKFILTILPSLEYEEKILIAQRRSHFIENHRQLVKVSSRLTTSLLAGLILCIFLATGLAFWGVNKTKLRLSKLSRHAHDVCSGDISPLPEPDSVKDELDDLEQCLSEMTKKLLHVVSVENVLNGVEKERRRIAMDMHDGVLADLTAINRMIDSMDDNSFKKAPEVRSRIDNIINLLRNTIDDLHPQVLETLGLESALRSFLQKQQLTVAGMDIHIQFHEELEELLTQQEKLNLFRILKEAIHNSLCHSQGDRLEVCMHMVNSKIIGTVEDNGKGMPGVIDASRHGCRNIQERANLIGATCEWCHSRFATGTKFNVVLPVKS